MVSFSNAKINIGLHVVSKRPDGYHNLETCFYPIGWSDILEILSSKEFEFKITGAKIPGAASENLCVKAYHLLKKDFDLSPVSIHLHKIVPIGAGLGGGSSNAARVLRMLNEIFNLSLSNERLVNYASQLGSDCAFFISDKPQLGKGRGNELTDIEIPSLKGKFIVVIKPPIHISTAEAYSGVRPAEPKHNLSSLLKQPVHEWKDAVRNDFEESIFKKFPEIDTIKNALYKAGALYASMSGSGSAVFGIFSGDQNIQPQFSKLEHWSGFLK